MNAAFAADLIYSFVVAGVALVACMMAFLEVPFPHYKHPDAAPWSPANSNWLDKRGCSVNPKIMTPFEWYFYGCEECVWQANGESLGTKLAL